MKPTRQPKPNRGSLKDASPKPLIRTRYLFQAETPGLLKTPKNGKIY